MAKKKLLSEAQVRRFMGLAGVDATLASNALSEMYSMKRDDEEEKEVKEEGMYAEEEPAADEELPPEPAEEPAEMGGDEMDAAPAGDEEVELSPEDVKTLQDLRDKAMAASEVVDKLTAAADAGEGEEADAGEEASLDEPAEMEPEEDEEVMEETLSGINLELNEDEIVQEVARRVSKRLLRAKKAQEQLDEALGRKNK